MKVEISNIKVNNTSSINVFEAIMLFNIDISGSLLAEDILSIVKKMKELSWDPITGTDYLIINLIADSLSKSEIPVNKVKLERSPEVSCDPLKFKYNIIISSTKSSLNKLEENMKRYFTFS